MVAILLGLTGFLAADNSNGGGKDGTIGAVSGPELFSDFFSINGVKNEYRAGEPTTATTTVCALRAPTYATSTLISGVAQFDVSSTTASTVTVAKASTAFATTTLIRTESVGANAQVTFPLASTTVSALEQTNRTFAPGQYLVVGMAGGVGTFSPTGGCSAVFQVSN